MEVYAVHQRAERKARQTPEARRMLGKVRRQREREPAA